MNAHNIVSHGSNAYNSSITESGATKQYSKESTNFKDYLSSNLKSNNYNSEQNTIGNSTKSEKAVESKLSSSLDRKTDKRVSQNTVLNRETTSASKSEIDANVDKLGNQMKDTIKETLDIDDKELEQIMSQLGLTMQDLLIPENLKLLCLAASGESDILTLLTNEQLSNQLSTLMDTLNEMNLNELGINEEELQSLLSDYQNGDATATTVIVEENQDTHIKVQPEEQVVLTTENELVSGQQDVNVVIEKEGEQSLSDENLSQQDSNLSQDSKLAMNQLDDENEVTKTDSTKEPVGEQFLNHLVQTTVSNVEVVNGQLTTVTQTRDIVNQIVSEIRVNISPETTNMELQLNPDNLGKVNLSIASKEGTITAQFTVETTVAKEAIESQIHMLRENLTNQGVKVESIEVTVSNFSFAESSQTFESNHEQKQSHKSLKLDGFDDDGTGQESDIIDELMQDYGNTVDYTA